jgi:hypothetical protein
MCWRSFEVVSTLPQGVWLMLLWSALRLWEDRPFAGGLIR